jgi:hypothetical protein
VLITLVAVDGDRFRAIVGLLRRTRTGQKHPVLLFVDARVLSYQGHPFLGILGGIRLEVIIARRGKEAENVFALVLWIFELGDSRELR